MKIFEKSEIAPLLALFKMFSSSNLKTFLIGLITVFVFVSNIKGSQNVSSVMIDTTSEGKISNLRFKRQLWLQSCYALSKYESAKLIFFRCSFYECLDLLLWYCREQIFFNWQEAPFDTWTKYVCQDFLWASCCCISFLCHIQNFQLNSGA